MAKKLRPLGDITGDIEHLLLEMTQDHDLQFGEVLALVYAYLSIHCPASRETYTDGSHPTFHYGYSDTKTNHKGE